MVLAGQAGRIRGGRPRRAVREVVWSIRARGDWVEVDARSLTLCMAVRQFQGRDGRHDERICRSRDNSGSITGRSRENVEIKVKE